MTASPILLLDNVSRVHGRDEIAVRALDGVTPEVHAGEMVAVMGPSGSGKWTLLNLAGGLDQPTSGTVIVEGADVGAMCLRPRAQRVAGRGLGLDPEGVAQLRQDRPPNRGERRRGRKAHPERPDEARLAPSEEDHRRVLAVLAWLRGTLNNCVRSSRQTER